MIFGHVSTLIAWSEAKSGVFCRRSARARPGSQALGISRQTLFDILSEKQPITPAMALRFGKLLGSGPDLWIDLQRAYDRQAAEKQLVKVLAKIPTITAA
jgi:addiction module HigA family antidote